MKLPKEFQNAIENGIISDTFIINTKSSPVEQLIAGGRLSILIQIAREYTDIDCNKLSGNRYIKSAMDFVTEMRYYNEDFLRARNIKLESTEQLAKKWMFDGVSKSKVSVKPKTDKVE